MAYAPGWRHERAGHRLALVLSRLITRKPDWHSSAPSRVRGYPFEVLLPSTSPVTGVVLADQIKSLDWRARCAATPPGRWLAKSWRRSRSSWNRDEFEESDYTLCTHTDRFIPPRMATTTDVMMRWWLRNW